MKVRTIGHGGPIKLDSGQWGYTYYIDGHLLVNNRNDEASPTANAAKQRMREHVARLRRQNGITFRR